MTNCISNWSIFRKTVESEIKNDVKNDFSVVDLMGWAPDQKRKSTGNSYFYSIENYRAWASMIPIRILHIRWIRLFSIILPGLRLRHPSPNPHQRPQRHVHGGAPRCRRLDGQPWRVVVPIPGARSSMRPLVPLAVRHLNSCSSWILYLGKASFFPFVSTFPFFGFSEHLLP